MSLEAKIAIYGILVMIILWIVERFFPKERKISDDELYELFKKYHSINNSQPEIKGDGNKVTIINNINNKNG